MDIISIAVTLILIMDPFGNIPVFLSILDELPAHRRRRILVRELILALAVIMVFIFCGRYLMGFLGLKQEAVSIAGGIILFLIAIRMVFPRTKAQVPTECEGEPLLVPLAIPLIAGPSLLAVLILFSTSTQVELTGLLLASVLAWGVSFIVLFSATFLIRFLTRRGLITVERLMGMILVSIAVQLFLDGVASYLG